METDCAAVMTLLSWFPIVTPQGDGSVVIRPGKPIAEMTVTQAARFLGIHKSSVYRLIDNGSLTARRPLKKKTLIAAAVLEDWRERTKDPEYWDRRN